MATPTVHTLGPGFVFVRFRNETTGLFLGTCELDPKIDVEIANLEVKNSVSGRSFPHQKVVDGERHIYSVVLNRFNYELWNRVRDTYYHATSNASHGFDNRFKRGSLFIGIGDMQIIHINGFTGVSPAHPLALPEQPAGRLYLSAELANYVEDPTANRAQTIAAVFKCDGVYDPTTLGTRVYSEVPTDFGTLGPIS